MIVVVQEMRVNGFDELIDGYHVLSGIQNKIRSVQHSRPKKRIP